MKKQDLKTLQRKEAIKRIDRLTKKFKLNPHIKDYFNEGRVYYSYITAMIWGQIDTINYDARYVRAVKDFEERTHSLVYHAIETGDTLALLYVGDDPENWPIERLQGNCIGAYICNFTYPECSEDGGIFIEGYFQPELMNYASLIRVG